MNDKTIVIGGLTVVLLLIAAVIAFPLYGVHSGNYVRRPLWAPPELPIGHGYDNLSAEDIDRLSHDPAQREIVESMKNLARSYPASPIWLGNRYGPPKNPLAAVSLLAMVGYIVLLRYRGIV